MPPSKADCRAWLEQKTNLFLEVYMGDETPYLYEERQYVEAYHQQVLVLLTEVRERLEDLPIPRYLHAENPTLQERVALMRTAQNSDRLLEQGIRSAPYVSDQIVHRFQGEHPQSERERLARTFQGIRQRLQSYVALLFDDLPDSAIKGFHRKATGIR